LNKKKLAVKVNSTTLLSGVTYDPFGPATGWTWGNSTTSSRAYDEDGLPHQFTSAAVTYGYTPDSASRITGITDSGLSSDSFTFIYDLLDRVKKGSSTNKNRGYTYDANGNRLTTTGTTASTETISTTSNRLSSTSGGIVRTYGYDAAGNTTSFTGETFTFNDRGRMATATSSAGETNYVYNALGQLIEKSGNGGTTLLVYDEAGHLLGEYSSTGAYGAGNHLDGRFAGGDTASQRQFGDDLLCAHGSSWDPAQDHQSHREYADVALGSRYVRQRGAERNVDL
jgi:YD repeat-containing protein